VGEKYRIERNSSPGKHQLNEIAKLNRRIFITG